MDWTTVPDKQKDITREEIEQGPYPKPDENVLVTVESDFSPGGREVLMSSLIGQVWNDNYKWIQADGPAQVIAWKPTPQPYSS